MAFFNKSDNDVNVRVTSEADTKGIDQTTASISDLEQKSYAGNKAVAALGSVGKVAAIGVAAMGVATGFAGKAALDATSQFEQNRVAFDVMLGSAAKGRQMMQDIANFAKATPFELPEVVTASKQLLAFGFAQDQIIPTMRKLGDIAAGVGIPVGQLAYVYGQVRVAGKLMGGDLLQFTNAGVPMIEGLSKVLKVSQGDVKKLVEQGKVGFPEVQKVIDNMTNSGSQFGGMMAKQSQTFGGVVSNIKDSFGQVLRSAMGMDQAGDIVKGGLFDKLKNAANTAMPAINDFAQKVGPFMAKAIDVVGPPIGALLKGIGALTKFLFEHKVALAMVAGAIGGPLVAAFVAWAAAAAIAAANTLIALAPIILIGAAIAGVAYLISTNWEMIKDAFTGGVKWIGDKLTYLKDNFWSIVGEIISFWATLPIKIPAMIVEAITSVASWLMSFKWSDIWAGLWQSALNVADQVWQAIQGAWRKIVGLDWGAIVVNVGKGIANTIIDLINGGIRGAFRSVPILKDHIPQIPHFSHGVRNFEGGLAVVGDVNGSGGEVVDLPRGSNVYSNSESKQMMGAQNTYNIENVNLTTAEATMAWFNMQNRNGVLASKGISTVRPMTAGL